MDSAAYFASYYRPFLSRDALLTTAGPLLLDGDGGGIGGDGAPGGGRDDVGDDYAPTLHATAAAGGSEAVDAAPAGRLGWSPLQQQGPPAGRSGGSSSGTSSGGGDGYGQLHDEDER
jgi:hypothetical protein